MDKLARKSTPPKVNVQSTTTANDPWLSWYPLVDYVNARNSPGARPYCNCQPLKKISWIKQNHKNLTPRKIFSHKLFLKCENFPTYGINYLWKFLKKCKSKCYSESLAFSAERYKKLLLTRWEVHCTAASWSHACPPKVGRLIGIWKPSISSSLCRYAEKGTHVFYTYYMCT